MTVIGRQSDLTGLTNSASQGVIGQSQFEHRPFSRPGELVEIIPGMIATQHSGSGKANQFFLRGFNLDHGTDFAVSVDNVPLNLPSHGHGQGYLDLNSLIPELIDIVEFAKGPYHAEVGDFSAAGFAHFHTVHKLDQGLAKFTYGGNDFYRGVAANSSAIGAGDLLYASEVNFFQGPWQKAEKLRKYNGMLKYTIEHVDWGLSLLGTAYVANWDATDQIPQRAIRNGSLSRLGTIDPTDGGDTERFSLAGSWWSQDQSSKSAVSFYSIYSNLNLYSNFTFFLDDPINGDQIAQNDRRVGVGGQATYSFWGDHGGVMYTNTLGLQVRHDHIPDLALSKSRTRRRLNRVSLHEVNETSVGVFLQNEIDWHPNVRSVIGVRGDYFVFDVDDKLIAENSGDQTDFQLSPKFSVVLGPWFRTELFANFGDSFHSNDARGTSSRIDPQTFGASDPVDSLVRSRGAEAGLRSSIIPGLTSTLALWWLKLDSELIFVGDAGTTEPSDESRRYGLEWTNYYQPIDWLTLDADLALSQAKFNNSQNDGKEVPNSVGRTVSAGVTVDLPSGVSGSIRLRHFGAIPLNESGDLTANSTTIVNLALGYGYKDVRISLDLFNVFNSRDADISYFYASRLPGEVGGGVEDIHFHPILPRTLRGTISVRF